MPDFTPDLKAMLADLDTLARIESPSTDPAGIARVMDVVEGWARAMGAETHALGGGARLFNFGVRRADAEHGLPAPGLGGQNQGEQDLGGQDRPVLVLTHADTVWPHGTLDHMPLRVEGDRLYGPGTYDMKAGIVGLFHALRSLNGEWPAGGVQVLLSPDEETGSLSSRAHIENAARFARVALVVEPPVADTHALKTGRKGTGSYVLTFTGVASHAGNKPGEGASAVTAAAQAILDLQALARPDLGTTVSAGLIAGGSAVNVIPSHCRLELDVRVSSLEEGARVDAAVHAWTPADARVQSRVEGGLNRPPFEQGEGTLALYAQARAIARELGFDVPSAVVGGGSDGNFTAPIIPTLDGLGAPGDGAHAAHEHVRLDRWPDHVRLLARLLREV